jgi:peptide/nickel transport system ATP-binding protein
MTDLPVGHARPFIDVEELSVQFPTEDGLVRAVDGVTFSIERGKTLAVVGESGSGKSVTAQAIMGLVNSRTADVSGHVWLDGQDIVKMSDDELRRLRGRTMAMIFQDPMSSLHPFYRIGDQLTEAVNVHNKVSKKEARARAVEMLQKVGIPSPEKRVDDYPHQFSGGMRQRVMIAMALINSPSLLIADEPTTALDVTVQAQIMELIMQLQQEFNTAVILITHDLGIVADTADQVAVMYGARVVERGSIDDIFYGPQMPYTLGLLASVPRLNQVRSERLDPIPGNPPSPINLPKGCVFQPRCVYTDRVPDDLCATTRPELLLAEPGHMVRCHMTTDERKTVSAAALGALAGEAS